MAGPDSSYSSLEIHISPKVEREDKMEPPIQITTSQNFYMMIINNTCSIICHGGVEGRMLSAILTNVLSPDLKRQADRDLKR